jgi:hypothetical protein
VGTIDVIDVDLDGVDTDYRNKKNKDVFQMGLEDS